MNSERGPQESPKPDPDTKPRRLFVAGRWIEIPEGGVPTAETIQLESGPPPFASSYPAFRPDQSLHEVPGVPANRTSELGQYDPSLEEMLRRATGNRPQEEEQGPTDH